MSNTPGGWRPDEELGQLPPEYEPVHHEPRRRPEPSRTRPWGPPQTPQPQTPQPQSQQPPPAGWQPGPPQRARYEDQYGEGDGFMPGFADNPPNGGYESDGGYVPDGGYDPRDGYETYEPEPEPAGKRRRGRARQGDSQPPAKRRKVRWLAPWIAVLVILTPIAVGGYYAYNFYQSKYHPADYTGAGIATTELVHVQSGDTATSLAPQLVNLGVVASSRAFVLAAEHSTNTTGLVPGYFQLHEHMQASLAYAQLVNPANLVAAPVTIPEGLRTGEVLARLAAIPHMNITLAQYLAAVKNPALGLPASAKGNAEGYLFPATYQLPPKSTALSVLQMMVQRFTTEATTVNLEQAAAQRHLSPAQLIVVASLVQAEGGKLSDYPKIASVIYNRLAQGMKLQLDSSVLFGVGKYGIVASAYLDSNSPYNLYRFHGLPPGPIDNPGDAAIQAALHPAATNYLYFVTVDPATKQTEFTNSVTVFEQLQAELRHNQGQG